MKNRLEKHLLSILEMLIGIGWWAALPILLGVCHMSKKRGKRRKHQHQNQNNHKQKKKDHSENTDKTPRREPVAVMENVKYRSKVENPKPTINNTYPGASYMVVSKPAKWVTPICGFVGKVGHCLGTDRVHGAKLKFPSGEIIHIPFENIEIVDPAMKQNAVKPDNFVDFEEPNCSVMKNHWYKVVKKPIGWKTGCRFLDRTGECVLIDDRGARLRFSDRDEVSFPIECLREVSAVDLNKSKNSDVIDENNVNPGDLLRVIKRPDRMGEDADKLIGKIGKVKWTSYRGVCLKFADSKGESGYTINFDAVERYTPIQLGNPMIVPKTLNASNIVQDRKYKVIKLPLNGNTGLLNQMGKVIWASDLSKGAMMSFDINGKIIDQVIPFDCIGDLPRPTDGELLEIIKKNPEKILRIIKGLNKMTRLKPVMDFVEGAVLPDISQKSSNIPSYMDDTTAPPTIGEASELLQNQVLALIGPIQQTENPS